MEHSVYLNLMQTSEEYVRTPKRGRSEDSDTSPLPANKKKVENMSQTPSGTFTLAELKLCIAEVIEEKKVTTKEDLGNLASSIGKEIAALREENTQLKRDVKQLFQIVDSLESKSRKNNLVFGGLTVTNTDYIGTIENFLNTVMKMDGRPIISRAYPVGRHDMAKRIIVAEFVRQEDVFQILGRSRILKDTGFYVARDLSKAARARKTKLAATKRVINEKYPHVKTFWKRNELQVGNNLYHWEDDGGLTTNDGQDGKEQLKKEYQVELPPDLIPVQKELSA